MIKILRVDLRMQRQAKPFTCPKPKQIFPRNPRSKVPLAAAMAQKTLRVNSPNGEEMMVSVADETTVREILQQYCEDGVQDRQAALLRGVTCLEPDMTVKEAGFERWR